MMGVRLPSEWTAKPRMVPFAASRTHRKRRLLLNAMSDGKRLQSLVLNKAATGWLSVRSSDLA
jgi:hypothetical protein